jgi:hypothetical protein
MNLTSVVCKIHSDVFGVKPSIGSVDDPVHKEGFQRADVNLSLTSSSNDELDRSDISNVSPHKSESEIYHYVLARKMEVEKKMPNFQN